jgi:hypothetical protein
MSPELQTIEFTENETLRGEMQDVAQIDMFKAQTAANIEAARNANNVWTFEGVELEKFVANGAATVSVNVLNRKKGESGMRMVHNLAWTKDVPFVNYSNAFKTTLSSVGRNQEQAVKRTGATPINAALYKELITGATLFVPAGNGEFKEIVKSREEMIEFARIKPEAVSEVVETWFDAATIELIEDDDENFDWIFADVETVRVSWKLGNADNPQAVAILTFKAPTSEERDKFDNEVRRVKKHNQGEINIAEVSESFVKKLQYGAKHLLKVEGVSVGSEGVDYTPELKQQFITLFNPVWFIECTEKMHESFDFLQGKSQKT